jgi:hypothetical protein
MGMISSTFGCKFFQVLPKGPSWRVCSPRHSRVNRIVGEIGSCRCLKPYREYISAGLYEQFTLELPSSALILSMSSNFLVLEAGTTTVCGSLFVLMRQSGWT